MGSANSATDDLRAYTPATFAKAIGLGETKAREILASQEVRNFKVGRKIIVPAVEVDRWMRRQLGETDAA
jgi:hypothetical protein